MPRPAPPSRGRLAAAAVVLCTLTAGLRPPLAGAADPAPPPGFTALFNGKDFTGWHGWAIHAKGGSPADVAKMSPEQREKAFAAWTEDMKKTWAIDNGELVNHGK